MSESGRVVVCCWLGFSAAAAVSSFQYIDSACLEPATLQDEPVKYHEAWQKLCSAE